MLGIDPQIWGPYGWLVLHRLSFNFNAIKDAKHFFESLSNVLPCMKCRRNLKNHMDVIRFPSRLADVSKWVWMLHNRVNMTTKGNNTIEHVEYVDTKKRYAKMGVDPYEWIFIRALIVVHPGAFKATHEYIESLYYVLSTWASHSNVEWHLTMNDVQKKKKLEEWLRNTRKGVRYAKLRLCDTDVCSI